MMRAEKNKQTVKVGVFIAIGIVILIVAIFTLGGQQRSFAPTLTLHAVFDNVNGLQKGNNVFFSGVKVGTVDEMDFYGTSQVLVKVKIEKRVQKYIRKDAKARIGSEGLIGNKIVVIYDGTPASPQVEGGEELQVDKTVSTEDILASLQDNNNNLMSITSDLKMVSRRLAEGQGTIGALLTNDSIYRSMQAAMVNLQTAAKNSENLTKTIAAFADKLQQPGTLASTLVNDTVIAANLQATIAQLNTAAEDTRTFTQSLKEAGEKLQSGDNAAGMLLNDAEVARQVREIVANLESSSVKLDENLLAMQHNFLLRGFFRKRAAEQQKQQKEIEKQQKKERERQEKLFSGSPKTN